MDPFLEFRLGNISLNEFYRRSIQSEFERILEDPLSNMKNYRFSKQSNYSTKEKTPLSIGVNCLDIDDTGQVLLGGGDDGSLSIWGLDESLHRNDEGEQELINKRLNYIKRQPHQSDDEPAQIMGYKNKRTRINDNNTMRLVHSFQTQRNKYRMYRQSSAAVPVQRSHISNKTDSPIGFSETLSETDSEASISHHKYGITTLKWYKADNGMFFTGSNDKTVKIWDTNRFEAVQDINLGYKINQIDNNVVDDSSLLVVASEDYYPRLIDLRTMNSGVTALGMGNQTRMQSEILCCKFNPVREQIIACGDMEGGVKLWDLRMRNRLYSELKRNKNGFKTINNDDNDDQSDVYFSSNQSKAHLRCCSDIVWNSEGSELCSVGMDGKLNVWRPFTEILQPEGLASYSQLGTQDLSRIKYKKRVSRRLLWFDKFLLCITDNGEVEIYNTEEKKLWNKLEYPMVNQVKKNQASHCQFSSMIVQTNIMNSVGLKLFFGTNNNTVSDGGSIFECS